MEKKCRKRQNMMRTREKTLEEATNHKGKERKESCAMQGGRDVVLKPVG
jgi:hypothetical protein